MNRMKKINGMRTGIILLFFIFSVLTVIQLSAAADLRVELVSYSPYPAKPGDSFEARFRIENLENTSIDVTLKLDLEDPFFLISSEEQDISLEAREVKTLSYVIYVEGDADEGTHELELKYKIDDGDWEREEFDVEVREREVFLKIVSVNSDPEKIGPGEEAEIEIRLRNEASSVIKDITAKLDISDEELPIAPIGSITERRIEQLEEGEERELAFKVIVLADAELKVYKVPLLIDYSDEFGENYSKQDIISLVVWSVPELQVETEKSELILNMPSKVTISFLNKGLSDIKFLSVKITGIGYDTISSSSVYIGTIESDDYETLDFEIVPSRSVTLSLTLEYRDENNKLYIDYITLNPKVYTLNEAKQLGLIRTASPVWTILLAIIVVVIVLLIIRSRIRRKRRKL